MIRFFSQLRTVLVKLIDGVSRRSFSFRMNEAALLYLDDVRLYRPTADAGTLLQLESVFNDWSVSKLPDELKGILKKIIITTSVSVPDFDFRKIDSMTASKGFGAGFNPTINGSWFKNMAAWGRGMYPGENLRSDTLQDWKDNVWHIEHEGFGRNYPIHITWYGWYQRFVASNTGGSHHAAKVIYQGIRDNITYTREAVIETLSINADTVRELDELYISFIFLPKKKNSQGQKTDADISFRFLLSQLVSKDVAYLHPVHYHEDIRLAFISRDIVKNTGGLIELWVEKASDSGKLIKLTDYLKNPEAFHMKPYIHEVNNIQLGSYYM